MNIDAWINGGTVSIGIGVVFLIIAGIVMFVTRNWHPDKDSKPGPVSADK